MKNEFRICNLCRGVPYKELETRLKTLDPNATIKVGCQNVCGIGRKQPFVIVNKKLVTCDKVDELLNQVRLYLYETP